MSPALKACSNRRCNCSGSVAGIAVSLYVDGAGAPASCGHLGNAALFLTAWLGDCYLRTVFRLIYSSHSKVLPEDAERELGEIFTVARRSNQRAGITGALLITESAFA